MTALPYGAVPGPLDRESFSDAQRRHRRASWRFSLASAVATFVVGIPLSAVVSPLVLAVALLVVDVANLVTPVADPLARFHDNAGATPAVHTVAQGIAVVGVLLLPGAIVLVIAWLAVRRLFRRAATGGAVVLMGTRDADRGSLEEHQLANVVSEMSAAAGIPPSAFRMIDSPVANAGIVGSSLERSTVVVTTGLLDAL